MNDAHKYLTTAELAARWGISVNTVRNWRQTRKGPPFMKPSGDRGVALYKLDDIEAWERARTVTP